MKGDRPLTPEQRVLVEQNMPLVHWTVRRYMDVKENICGLGFEDLCQEGALALCYAAATYVAGKAQFKSYAITVIRNHLLDHCRRIAAQLKNAPTYPLDVPHGEDKPPPVRERETSRDDTEEWVSAVYVAQLLEHGKRHYSGVAKLGIEAMELKIKGYSGADIARLYHTKPNHVGAWISRAAEKLRHEPIAADLVSPEAFEKGA